MAFAPYWLMPTLWPLPAPVMVKVPSLECPRIGAVAAEPEAVTGAVPEEVRAEAESPLRTP